MVELDLLASLEKRKVRGTPAQRAGLYYERAVIEWFYRWDPTLWYCAQPALRLGRFKYRPDLLVFDREVEAVLVVEVKLQLQPAAVGQVWNYTRLVRGALPWCDVRPLIVCGQVVYYEEGANFVDITKEGWKLSEVGPNVFVLGKRELRLMGVGRGASAGVGYGRDGNPEGALRELGGVRDAVCGGGELLGVAAKVGAGGA